MLELELEVVPPKVPDRFLLVRLLFLPGKLMVEPVPIDVVPPPVITELDVVPPPIYVVPPPVLLDVDVVPPPVLLDVDEEWLQVHPP